MELTDAQRQAVETDFRYTLVLAAAGSGKTRVLVERIAHLIMHKGASPADFCVLTFTRRAAREMTERLDARAQELGERRSWTAGMMIGTIHAVALDVLRAEADVLGYKGQSLTVIDEADSDLLLNQVAEDLGYLHNGKWKAGLSFKKLRSEIDARATWARSSLTDEERMVCSRIHGEYASRLKAMNAVDYGLILLTVHRLFQDHETTMDRWRMRIKHLLVDELQDSNLLETAIYQRFAPSATTFMVGDLRQSIYGWRGARPDLIADTFDLTTMHLRENFRSGVYIVTAANHLASCMRELHEPMAAVNAIGSAVTTLPGRSGDIVAGVESLQRTAPCAWGDIAVLARQNRTLARLAGLMTVAGVPHKLVGAAFDETRMEAFRRLHAALRLIVNPDDRLARLRLQREQPATLVELADHKAEDMVSEVGFLLSRGMSLSLGHWWGDRCAGMTVRQALDWYATRDNQDDVTEGDQVTLSTIHAAKGLEWPVVIVAECNEGMLPSSQASRANDVEEERRVMYVAMTRAREVLVLHYRRPEDQAQDRKISEPSRFLAEAGL